MKCIVCSKDSQQDLCSSCQGDTLTLTQVIKSLKVKLVEKTDKLYNDTALEQLRELEYAIRDGLVYNDTQKAEVIKLCEDIVGLLTERIK